MSSKIFLSAFLFVFATRASAQLRNADFEDWSDTSQKPTLVAWQHMTGTLDSNDTTAFRFGTYRTDTAEHGTYALKLSRWYSYTMDWVREIVPVTTRPTTIRGYYSYVDNVLTGPHLDTASIHVSATRWNTGTNDRDTVGYVEIDLGPSAEFAPFSGTVHYSSAAMPDSINVSIAPSCFRAQGVAPNGWGSYLTVDNLSFDAAESVASHGIDGFAVYPNPAQDQITLQSGGHSATPRWIDLYDPLGRNVLHELMNPGTTTLDVQRLPTGYYTLISHDDNGSQNASLIKK